MQEREKAKTSVGRIGVGVIGVHPLFINYVSIGYVYVCTCICTYVCEVPTCINS